MYGMPLARIVSEMCTYADDDDDADDTTVLPCKNKDDGCWAVELAS